MIPKIDKYKNEEAERRIRNINISVNLPRQVLFWPDFVTCHYKKENLDFLRDNGIAFVEKAENPPNAPQIRPNGLQSL